jgi:hypothetical protein
MGLNLVSLLVETKVYWLEDLMDRLMVYYLEYTWVAKMEFLMGK